MSATHCSRAPRAVIILSPAGIIGCIEGAGIHGAPQRRHSILCVARVSSSSCLSVRYHPFSRLPKITNSTRHVINASCQSHYTITRTQIWYAHWQLVAGRHKRTQFNGRVQRIEHNGAQIAMPAVLRND